MARRGLRRARLRARNAAYCVRASRLFHELHVARGDVSYTLLLARLAKTDLLVIDDWGLTALTSTERQDVLEILGNGTPDGVG